MQNGSLDTWLHKDENEQHHLRCLNFIQRLNVAIDVANALDYLHHHCEDPVVHCDLKPSNILLNEDMVAHVGDFGLARIFYKDGGNCSQAQSSSVWIKGSIGYVAPGNKFYYLLFYCSLYLLAFIFFFFKFWSYLYLNEYKVMLKGFLLVRKSLHVNLGQLNY